MTRVVKTVAVAWLLSLFSASYTLAEFDGRYGYTGRGRPVIRMIAPTAKSDEPGVYKKYKEGEVLVKFKEGVPEKSKKDLHNKHGAEKLKEFPDLRLHHVKLKKGVSVEEAIERYKADLDVEYAEPNFAYQSLATPNDQQFSQLWGMLKTSAPLAWNSTTGSNSVVVAIIDTGIDHGHEDLSGNIWINPGETAGNGVDDDGDGYIDDIHGIDTFNHDGDPFDDHGHGTHVAGTIGAVGNNGIGVAGMNWQVKMVACKFLGAGGTGYSSGAIECLQYVRALKDRGVNIVATNNSWGGEPYSQALSDAITAQRDILFIAAAGNSSKSLDTSPFYPASYSLPNVIAVAATDENDGRAWFSNYGRRSVHIAAPGNQIFSTVPLQNNFGISGGYGLLSGTSMATPHVTGLAALLKAQSPGKEWWEIRNLILSGGENVAAFATKSLTGKRINLLGSMTCANRPSFYVGGLGATVTAGTAYKVSVGSTNCGTPVGPVTASTTNGTSIELNDTGTGADTVAGDGIFTGTWTAGATPVMLTFSSPAGSQKISFPPLQGPLYIPDVRRNTPYSQPIRSTGGLPPYVWSIVSGALPAGLGLDPATGIISGQSGSTGNYPITVQVTDSGGQAVSQALTLRVVESDLYEPWAEVLRGVGDTHGNAVAIDRVRNSYVTGRLYNGSNYDAFVAKYDPAGELLWMKTYDYGRDEEGQSIAFDSAGFVYIAGISANVGALDSDQGDNVLLKYDVAGNLVWGKTWRNPTSSFYLTKGLHGVAVDDAGYVYTIGEVKFWDPDNWLRHRVEIAKYDSGGQILWSRVKDATVCVEEGNAIAVDGSGNIYFGGMSSIREVRSGDYELFYYDFMVGKYDSNGNLEWVRTLDESGIPYSWNIIEGVAVDSAGNVLATGWSGNGTTLKYDPSGNLLWKASNNRLILPYGLATYGEKVFIAGSTNMDYGVTEYDSLGKEVWSTTIDTGNDNDNAMGIAADSAGVTVTGYAERDGEYYALTARYIDITPPATTVTPPGGAYDTVQTVSLRANEPGSIYYTLDGSTPTTGSPVYAGPISIAESCTLRFFAADTAGNVEGVKSQTYGIRPKSTIEGAPPGVTKVTSASLTIGGGRVVAYKYAMDGGDYSAERGIATPISLTSLADGTHTVSALGKDSAGYWQTTPTSVTWRVDTTPPAAIVSRIGATLVVGGADVVAFKCAIDGGLYLDEAPISIPIGVGSLGEGIHTISVIGKDSVGNWQVDPTIKTWVVDAWPVTVVSGGDYHTVLGAYSSILSEDVVLIKPMSLFENLIFNRNVRITLRGGYDHLIGTATDYTVIIGSLEISDGAVNVENLILAAVE